MAKFKIFFLLVLLNMSLFFIVPTAYSFNYLGVIGPNAPSNNEVKIISPNHETNDIFSQPTLIYWRCVGGKVLVTDFDGDNQNDIIIGGGNGNHQISGTYAGAIFILKGPINPTSHSGTFGWDIGDWSNPLNSTTVGYILGFGSSDHTGFAIASGNIGGRALIIGHPTKTNGSSKVSVIYGRNIANLNISAPIIGNLIDMQEYQKPGQLKNFDLIIKNIPNAHVSNVGDTTPGNAIAGIGMALACGDVTGDGVDDIIIGCPNTSTEPGRVYIIKGKTQWNDGNYTNDPIELDVTTMSSNDGYIITGYNNGDNFGTSLLVADIYGDNKKELIIGAPGINTNKGAVAIIPGGVISGWTNLNYNITAISEAKVVIGPDNGKRFGHALTSGKFHDNGALNEDLVISEFIDNNIQTSVYVVYGGTLPSNQQIPVDLTIKAYSNSERFGYTLACGDINGDNFDDIAISAPTGKIGTSPERGKVYVVHGVNYASGTILDLSDNNKPHFNSTLQVIGNTIRHNDTLSNYFFGIGVAIGEVGGLSNTRKELIVSGYSELPTTDTFFSRTGYCGANYVFYTSTCPNKPTTNQIPSPSKGTNFTVQWSNFFDPEGDAMTCYQLQFATNNDFNNGSIIFDTGIINVENPVNQHNVTISNDGKYYYRVRVGDSYSFSQFSDFKELIIDNTPPTNLEDITPINGQDLVASGGPRQIKVKVTDNLQCNNSITANVWIKSQHDTNNNNIWDESEGQTYTASPIGNVTNITEYSFNINEGTQKDEIRIYFTGTDLALNNIPDNVSGTRNNPKIIYFLHSTQGPQVSNWTITPRPGFDLIENKFTNDLRPTISAQITDDDGTPINNITLRVQGTNYGIGTNLTFTYPTLIFTPTSNLMQGSLPVTLISATDKYNNPLQPNNTNTGYIIDNLGPTIIENLCQPINGGSVDKATPTIILTLKDYIGDPNTNGVAGCGLKDSLEIKIFNKNIWTIFTYESGIFKENGVQKTPSAITINTIDANNGIFEVKLDLSKTSLMLEDGPSKAEIKAYDKLNNQLQGETYTINFTVSLKGPLAQKLSPQPDYVKVNNAIVQIRIYSEDGYFIDTTTVNFKILGPTNNVIYQRIGCNNNELTYNTTNEHLIFDPVKAGITYDQGTITVLLENVKDSEGNELRNRPYSWKFIFDSIGPVAGTETVPNKDAWTNNNKQIIKMKLTDALSNVNPTTIKLKIDGIIYTTSSLGLSFDPNTSWLTFDPTIQGIIFSDKTINVELIEALDEIGNPLVASSNNSWSFKVDATPPVVSNFDPPNNTIKNTNSFQIKCKLTDNFSGLDTSSIVFKINNNIITTYTLNSDGILSYNGNFNQGVNTCEINVKDIAENFLVPNPTIWTFIVDGQRMEVIDNSSSTPTSPNPYKNTYINYDLNTITIKMTKTFSGLDTNSILFTVKHASEPGKPQNTILGSATAEEYNDHFLLKWTATNGNLPEGIIYVELEQCKNNAGWNFLNPPFIWQFTVDKTRPFITQDNTSPSPPNNSIQTNNKVQISLKLDDKLAGINPQTIILAIADGGQSPPGTEYTITNPQLIYDNNFKLIRFTTTNPFSDGKLTVTLKEAKDKAGNSYLPPGIQPYSWFFFIDTTKPTCAITYPANDNTTVLTNDDYIEAILEDTQGINTNEIRLTLISSVTGTIENMLPINNPYFTFTSQTATKGILKYNPQLKNPPLKFADSEISVFIYAKDNAGFELNPNPITRIYKVDTTGPVIIDGTKPDTTDSRTPKPDSTIGLNAGQSLQIKCRIEDVPSGIDKDSITYKFSISDEAGNTISDNETTLTIIDISPTVVEVIYKLPNTKIPFASIPNICTCEMEIINTKDKSPVSRDIQNTPSKKWKFYINNSLPIAQNPQPPDGSIIKSNTEEVSIEIFHVFGISTASIEFYYNNNKALFTNSPTDYLFEYNETNNKLIFRPKDNNNSKWKEGTNTVELRHAKEKNSFNDIKEPVIWSFICDTQPPRASLNSPNTQYVTNQNFDILINLTDNASGINPQTVIFELKKPTDTEFNEYYLIPGSPLTYNFTQGILKFSLGQPYQPGTYEIRLKQAKDKAGYDYITPPYSPSGPLPLTHKFAVVTSGPKAYIIQPIPNDIVDYNLKPGSDEIIIGFELPPGSPGIDPNSIELELTEGPNPTRVVKLIPGSGLNYDSTQQILKYKYSNVMPPLPVFEGKVTVKLKNTKDYLGNSYISEPNPLQWSFIFDTKSPILYEETIKPLPNGFALTETQEITMRLSDGPNGSGFDTSSIQLQVKYYPKTNPTLQKTFTYPVGTFLKFEHKPQVGVKGEYLLTFTPQPEFAEGSVEVTLVSCKDQAGHNYISDPSNSSSYKFEFMVDLNPPKLFDNDVQPGHIAGIRYTKNNLLPIIMKFDDGNGSQINPNSIRLFVANKIYQVNVDANLLYDQTNKTLTFTPTSAYNEGTIVVRLEQCKDYAGRSVIGIPSNTNIPYEFKFVCDTVKPKAINPVPTNNAITSNTLTLISVQLKDETSGVNNYWIKVFDKNNNLLPLMPNATIYDPNTYVLRTRTKDPLPNGTISVEVWCQDRATNEIESTNTPASFKWSFLVSTEGPTVSLISPNNTLHPKYPRINNNSEKLEFLFNDNGVPLEQNSITLTITQSDSQILTFKLNQPNYLTYDNNTKKLIFNPMSNNPSVSPPILYKDGTLSVQLNANNINGFALTGTKNWQFLIDSKGPYVIPNSVVPIPNTITGNAQPLLKLRLKDDLGTIDKNTILFKIVNSTNTYDNITLTTLGPTGLKPLNFDEANSELTFDTQKYGISFNGEVIATLKQVKDDLGNNLIGGQYSWKFNINSTSPWASDPTVNKIKNGIIGPEIAALDAIINSQQFITSMLIHPQQPSSYINKNTIKVKIGNNTYSYSEPAITYVPIIGKEYGKLTIDITKLSPQPVIPNNGSIEISLVDVENNLGTKIASPFKYNIIIDTQPPVITDFYPANNSIINNKNTILTATVNDSPNDDIDINSIELTINGRLFNVTSGGISYNKLNKKIEFNPLSITPVFSYKTGINNVTITNLADKAGNYITTPVSWSFILDDVGPIALLNTATPTPNSIIGNPNTNISIKVTSQTLNIDPTTFKVRIQNLPLDLIISGINEAQGVTYNPITSIYQINPTLHPQLKDQLNGTVSVWLNEVKNQANNSLQNPTHWEYFIDKTGPKVKSNLIKIGPPVGLPPHQMTSNKTQKVFFDIEDENHISQIDIMSLKMKITYGNNLNLEVGAYSNGCDYSVSLGRFTFDPSKLIPPLQFPDGKVTCELIEARDIFGNPLQPSVNNKFEFFVNTEGPEASNPKPEPNEIVGDNKPQVSFIVTTKPGTTIDLSKPIEIKVNGILFSNKSTPSPITLVGNKVTFDPQVVNLTFGSMQVTVEIVSLYDSLGNNIKPSTDPKIGPTNSWTFKVDITPPTISGPFPAHQSVVGIDNIIISATIRDNMSLIDKNSIKLKVNDDVIDNSKISFDSTTGKVSCDLSQSGLPKLRANDNKITIFGVKDSVGNEIKDEFSWNVFLDRNPPYVVSGSERPQNNSTGNVLKPVISFDIADSPNVIYGNPYFGDIDYTKIKVRIINNSLNRIVKYGDIGFYYSKPKVMIDTALLGLNLTDGTCEVSILGLESGSDNALSDVFGNKMINDYKFRFNIIATGPYVYGIPEPRPNSVITTNKPQIKINLRSDKSQIRPSTIKLLVDGVTYTTSSQALTYVGDEVRFNPENIGLTLREGSIEVWLIEAEDELGNKLKQDTSGINPWTFRIDTKGPTATLGINPTTPNNPTQVVITAISDEELKTTPKLKLTFGDQTISYIDLNNVSIIDNTKHYWANFDLTQIPKSPVSFTFIATDINNINSETLISNFKLEKTQITPSFPIKASKYYLMGIPVVPDNTNITNVLSGLGTNYTIWEGHDANRKIANNIKPGYGYWLLNSNQTDINLKVNGYEMINPLQKFNIPLKAGWNLISIPYNNRMKLSLCSIKPTNSSNEIPFFAKENTYTEHAIWSYEYDKNNNVAQFAINHIDAHLTPFKGYYIYAYTDCTLYIPNQFITNEEINKNPIPPLGLKLESTNSNNSNLWYKLSVTCDEAYDEYNYFGIKDDASDNNNDLNYDLLEPPINPNNIPYISTYFGSGSTLRYCSDFKSPTTTRKKWNLIVKTNVLNKVITLSWQKLIERLPYNYELLLYDRLTNSVVNMQNTSQYTFTVSNSNERLFTIIFNPINASDVIIGGNVSDTKKPTLIYKLPFDNQQNVPISTSIYIRFDEKLNPNSVLNSITLTNLSTGSIVRGNILYNDAINEVTFKPETNLTSNSIYRINVANISDLAGNVINPMQWTFETTKAENIEKTVKLKVKKGWNLISIPLYPKFKDISEIFNGINSQFKLYYRRGNQTIVYNDKTTNNSLTIGPGYGYWLYLNSDNEVEFEILGYAIPTDQTANPYFEIALVKGFNQLGVPFILGTQTITPANFEFKLKNSNNAISLISAIEQGYVRNTIYTFTKINESGQINPQSFTDVNVKLKQNDGFFIYSERDDLILRIPKPNFSTSHNIDSNSKMLAAPINYKIKDNINKNWKVKLNVTTSEKSYYDMFNYFGINEKASINIDKFDVIKLLPPDPYITLYFVTDNSKTLLSSDIKNLPTDINNNEIKWEFIVTSKGIGYTKAILNWDKKELPNYGKLILVDKLLNNEIDMNQTTSYSFELNDSNYEFEILFNVMEMNK